jgi:hypothetical protein
VDYRNVVRDFAQRTNKNLVFIEQSVGADPELELYETTQLLNSMLGLLVFPKAEYYKRIPKIPLTELEIMGWPNVQVLEGNPPCGDLRELVRLLRNAVSHFNIEFLANEQTQQLTGMRLWNEWKGKKTWGVELTLNELRQIAMLFIDLIEDIFQWTQQHPSEPYDYRARLGHKGSHA